ncbi:aminotransferase class IV [Streptomyces sp. V4-01]|uniref:Aminotransferase class IV n=1 Tax=Actinacidiphila polyblastidii TaxID=3110430 RepID=A0ABU7PJW2_9ACTN|nr:aminotransferase class IV [Streptomyces sp. V4-01]
MIAEGLSAIEVDGRPATVEALAPALAGYGHFSAMQVRDGRTRGLRFHLERLDGATRELFGAGLDAGRVRSLVRHALASAAQRDGSVRINVFQPVEAPGSPVRVLVTVRPPGGLRAAPYRVRSVLYQRPAAHLKHVGGFGQGWFGRRVAADGYDEALLTGPAGEVAEGAVTNVGFLDGDTVVWPTAPHLRGITLQVLEERLHAAGVRQERRPVTLSEAVRYDGAFLTNSRGTAVIREIDGTPMPTGSPLLATIAEAYASAPWDEI